MKYLVRVLGAVMVVAGSCWLWAQEKPASKTANSGKSALDNLLDGTERGTLFRLVTSDDKPLQPLIYWRTMPGTVAASVPPVEFRLGDAELIAPKVDPQGAAEPTYPISGRAELKAGKYTITPGNLALEVTAAGITSNHPAIKVASGPAGQEVLIRCAPVRLEAVDTRGVPQPMPARVTWGNKSLLRKDARFTMLTLWLPLGSDYATSLGTVRVTETGQVQPLKGELAEGVQLVAGGLRRTVPMTSPADENSSPVISVQRGEGQLPVRWYVTPVVVPGQPALVATSRKQFQTATNAQPVLSEITSTINYLSKAITPEAAQLAAAQPTPAQASAGAAALGTAADDLFWFSASLPAELRGPVTLSFRTASGLHWNATILVAELGQGLELIPHRWRTTFAETETADYLVVITGPQPKTAARLIATLKNGKSEKSQPLMLSTIELPLVEAGKSDSRTLSIRAGDLPPGEYELSLRSDSAHSGRMPLTVVPWMMHSPFFTHSMSGCTACWPTTNEGLAVLRSANLDMGTATGSFSQIDADMPSLNRQLAARVAAFHAGAPAELAVVPSGNDRFFDRLTAHQLRYIDLAVVRAEGMYNEGLSYHHSHGASVERMIRRMQVFTQQTGDYASFWGINYSWFPALHGYVEGGVPTDAHTAERNKALAAAVKAAGTEPLSKEDRDWLKSHASSTDSADRARVQTLMAQAVKHWKTTQELGWGQHNALYNQHARQVRPDLVCTLFENAGHDEGKRTRSMFGDMNASCYESYTDYGDWPMSSAFVTDWAHANRPGAPVWLTTCWGTSSDGAMKSLLHSFARGLDGGGVPMQDTNELTELARRAKGLKFVSQYGALVREARPDRRVTILSRAVNQVLTQRGLYIQHAIYYHLTRLGYPPALVADEEVISAGVPSEVQVLVLPQEGWPLEEKLAAAINSFQARGGKVLSVGQPRIAVAGAIEVDVPLKHLWQFSGFKPDAHRELWQEFNDHWREPLAAAMQRAGVEPWATTDIDRAITLGMDAGPVRYVAVIADAKDTHSNEFQRPTGIPVSLAGTGWRVRDLAKQLDLKTNAVDGRTEVLVDLVTEPTTILALFKQPLADVAISLAGKPRLGEPITFSAQVMDVQKRSVGKVPISCQVYGPDNQLRRDWFAAAGQPQTTQFARLDQPGKWRIEVQELITGQTAVAEIDVAAAENTADSMTAQLQAPVHVVNQEYLQKFLARQREKWVIVEPGQERLLPIAEKLVSSLQSAGVTARIWKVEPHEFDTLPLRWYPQPDDEARMELIRAGKLVGYRGHLKAHIDKLKRVHVPELGGYGDIDPPYIVGEDAIVFSGGKLCDSLKAVTAWSATPNSPGRGEGRLVVCFSPFMADRQVAAVIANDDGGLAKAAQRLVEHEQQSKPGVPASGSRLAMTSLSVKSEVRSVPTPYRDYSPEIRLKRLVTARGGQSAVLLSGQKDDVVLLDATGRVTGTFKLPNEFAKTPVYIDDAGQLQLLSREVLAKDASWGFAKEMSLELATVGVDGRLKWRSPAYRGSAELAPDHQAGFRVTPDGKSLAVSRASALIFGPLGQNTWRRYDELPHVARRFEVLYPRTAVGTTFSPDGRYLLCTFDSRPPFGNMGQNVAYPASAETILLDLQSGERVWSLRDENYQRAPFAVHSGFGAVAVGGELTAIAGYDGAVLLVDRRGQIVAQEQVGVKDSTPGRVGPKDGVGVWMSEHGELTAFGFENVLVFARDRKLQRIPVPGLASGCVTLVGSQFVGTLASGQVFAINAAGEGEWTLSAEAGSQVAATRAGVLVATGGGKLQQLDLNGKPIWSTDVTTAADAGLHPLEKRTDFAELAAPPDYAEPETLQLAKQHLSAQQVTAWKPSGKATSAYGRDFYTVNSATPAGAIELTAPGDGEFFVHLVYRKPEENKSLEIAVRDRDGENTFQLDLPTPEYRAVDLPLRGVGARASLRTSGPIEVAEFSLWSLRWPGNNQAFVKPAGAGEVATGPAKAKPVDDILADLGEKPAAAATGQMKDCKIYFPNSDPDRVKGPYLRAPVDPTRVVDAKRFEPKLPAWASASGISKPSRGAFFTIDFGQPAKLSLLATYDRSSQQSNVCHSLVAFSGENPDEATSGRVLRGVVRNDQFWRLLPLPKAPLKVLGVHVFTGQTEAVGLSEIEVY